MAEKKATRKPRKASETTMSVSAKKDYAKMLYTIEGVTVQKELAQRVGVSAQTINSWVNKEHWDMLLGSVILTKEAEHRRLMSRLTFLNDTLDRLERDYKSEETAQDEKDKIINRITKIADSISKVGAGIKQMETDTSLSDAINVMKEVITHARSMDYELAKQITLVADDYVKSKMK